MNLKIRNKTSSFITVPLNNNETVTINSGEFRRGIHPSSISDFARQMARNGKIQILPDEDETMMGRKYTAAPVTEKTEEDEDIDEEYDNGE